MTWEIYSTILYRAIIVLVFSENYYGFLNLVFFVFYVFFKKKKGKKKRKITERVSHVFLIFENRKQF